MMVIEIILVCAGAFLAGVFFAAGAVGGIQLGGRVFGPIRTKTSVSVDLKAPLRVIVQGEK